MAIALRVLKGRNTTRMHVLRCCCEAPGTRTTLRKHVPSVPAGDCRRHGEVLRYDSPEATVFSFCSQVGNFVLQAHLDTLVVVVGGVVALRFCVKD